MLRNERFAVTTGLWLGQKASSPASVCPCCQPDSVSFDSLADGGSGGVAGDQSVIMAYSPSEGVLLSSSAGSVLTHLNDSDTLSRSFPSGSKSRRSRLSGLCQLGASLPGEHSVVRLSSHGAFGPFQIFPSSNLEITAISICQGTLVQ